jgi:fructose-1-phosphate kinase PfkB-like protein
MRCETPRYDAGAAGINVSKAIAKLVYKSTAGVFTLRFFKKC